MMNFKICWTNLKRPAIVGFPWPIYNLPKVYIACLLSYFGIASNLFRFVELINLNPESAKQFSVSRKIIYSCLMALINMRIYQFYSIIGDDFADIIMANTYSF
jgi:hypothetical protein